VCEISGRPHRECSRPLPVRPFVSFLFFLSKFRVTFIFLIHSFIHSFFLAYTGLNTASTFLCILIMMIPFFRSRFSQLFHLSTQPVFYHITALPLLATLLSARQSNYLD